MRGINPKSIAAYETWPSDARQKQRWIFFSQRRKEKSHRGEPQALRLSGSRVQTVVRPSQSASPLWGPALADSELMPHRLPSRPITRNLPDVPGPFPFIAVGL